MRIKLLIICFLTGSAATAQQKWTSDLVKINKDGSMRYVPDAKGNILPDFSRVGYHNNQQSLPWLDVVKTVEPSANDQEEIQSAINEVALKTPDANGFRGAILLKKGIYKIPGTLKITAGGIVLRGEGEATRLIATGKGQRKLITVMGTGSRKEIAGTRQKIIDNYVPVGARSFKVSRPAELHAGDAIVLYRPATANWIADLKMDKIAQGEGTIQWKPADYNLEFERKITAIKGNEIFIDQPVVMAMETKYGGGELYKYTFDGRIAEVGIERLCCESEFVKPDDEDHGWDAVYFNRVENGWIREVTAKYFGYSCVNLGGFTKNITVVNCKALEPKSQAIGGRRYSFNNDGQLNLVMNCYALEGRHDFVTGARVAGPNVFFNCRSEKALADNGPHHRWAAGTLFDNIVTDGEINIQDRGNWGTGHGWAGVNQVVWNCAAASAAIQNPWVSGNNYSIGLKAAKREGRLPGRPDGIWEGQNRAGLEPSSLYMAQVKDSRRSSSTGDLAATAAGTLRRHILEEAAWALKQEPVTVTASRSPRSAGGKHDFYSEGDYWWPDSTGADRPYVQRDGLTNPDNFTAHREAMIRFSRIVGALASAYKLTGDIKYVQHAIKHCKAWFADKETLMNPALLYAQAIKGRATGRGIGIIDTIQLMEVVQGLMAMQDSGVDRDLWHTFQKWFEDYLNWLTTHPYGKEEMEAKNNHGTCWVMQVAVFSKFTGNQQLLDLCRERFKTKLLPEQMAADGSFPLEIKRTKPFGYSIFNLDAMATICQVLSVPADDLWTYTTIDGKSVEKGIAFLYLYLKDKNKWPFKKDVMYWENWPVAQPALLFGAVKYSNKQWLTTWQSLDHAPREAEVIRNLPVRNPIIWLN